MNKCLNCKEQMGEWIQRGSCESPVQTCKNCRHTMAMVGNMYETMVDVGVNQLIGDKNE